MYPLPSNEDEGITNARQALDDLRTFSRSRAANKVDGRGHALRIQLKSLEDMLRVVTDRRYARSLAESDSSLEGPAITSLGILQFIISTTRDIMSSSPRAEVATPDTATTLISGSTMPLSPPTQRVAPRPSTTGLRELILARRYPIDPPKVQPLVVR